jgi:hypothetical protein
MGGHYPSTPRGRYARHHVSIMFVYCDSIVLHLHVNFSVPKVPLF